MTIKEKSNLINISEPLAEFIGILLGDGHFHRKGKKSYLGNLVSISLNRIDEPEYMLYVKNLMTRLFNSRIAEHIRIDSKSIDLKLYSEEVVDFLIKLGLKTGNKVLNQINVPQWIKNNKMFTIACLRGLTDTDGTLYIDKFNKIICVGFKNGSLPLVKDYKVMCDSLNIRTGKITKSHYSSKVSNNVYLAFQVLIRAKSHVKQFLEIIKPLKWEYKKEELQRTLISLDSCIDKALRSNYKRKDAFLR